VNSATRRFALVTQSLVNEAVELGFIRPDDPKWWGTPAKPFRYSTILDYDIPAVVEIGPWREGICNVRWALWPKNSDVDLDVGIWTNPWPGEVWGTAYVDGRCGFKLLDTGRFHCRAARQLRLDDFDTVLPDSRFTHSMRPLAA